MAHELESGIAEQVLDVRLGRGVEVVNAKDFVAVGQQALTQVRTDEPCAARDQTAESRGARHHE